MEPGGARGTEAKWAAAACEALEAGTRESVLLVLLRPFLVPATRPGEPRAESPLSFAAAVRPELVLSMLAAGADPRRVPEGGGTLLWNLLFWRYHGRGRQRGAPCVVGIFGGLLRAGVDPSEPVVWRAYGPKGGKPFRRSAPAFLL